MLGALVGSPPVRRGLLAALGCAAGLLALVACTIGAPDAAPVDADGGTSAGTDPTAADGPLDRAVSTTDAVAALVDRTNWDALASYHVEADVDPTTGVVVGRLTALLPVGAGDDAVHLAYTPFVDGVADDPYVEGFVVEGEPVEADVKAHYALVSIPVEAGDARRVRVELAFGLTAPEPVSSTWPLPGTDAADEELVDAERRLLVGRLLDGGVLLGSWYPSLDRATEDGELYRKIAPAAEISLEITVPAGYEVLTGGVRTARVDGSTSTVVHDQSIGARGAAVLVLEESTVRSRVVRSTTITATVTGDDPDLADALLDDAEATLTALEDQLGPYPWTELDVVSLSLPFVVDGIAYPGIAMAERGRVDVSAESLEVDRGLLLAHEIAHQWWGGTVTVADADEGAHLEALAQLGGCLVLQERWPDDAARACREETTERYLTMRAYGIPDAAIDHSGALPIDQRTSLVYGKAPGLYTALAAEHGEDELVAALRDLAAAEAFGLLTPGELVDRLGTSLGDEAGVLALRDRWFGGMHGDEDLGFVR